MPAISRKSLDEPDEQPPLGQEVVVDQVDVRGLRVKRAVFAPGWHWKKHVSEELCTTRHAGFVASGRLRVVSSDGSEAEIQAGDVVVIDPGHDAWTVGGEACVFIDFGEGIDESRLG
jgi:quercetin dioxygenase-like cupin family protein